MAERNEDNFLDDIDQAEAEEYAEDSVEVSKEEIELDTLRAERDAFQDKFMRALADAENVRKRSERDRREAEKYGGTRLARDLLPVYDNMKRAVDAISEDQREASAALIEGIEITMRELIAILGKHGVRIVSPEVGDKFDPQVHEAMFEAPLPGTKAGEIIQISAEGFMLHDRILRPAQVGVSSMPG